METLTIKNSQFDVLVTALNYKMLPSEGRIRARFFDLFQSRMVLNEKARNELCEKYAQKNDDGKPIILKDQYVMNTETLNEFNEEYKKFSDEEFVIDILPSRKKDFEAIEKFLLESKVEMEIKDTSVYLQLCEAFLKALHTDTAAEMGTSEEKNG